MAAQKNGSGADMIDTYIGNRSDALALVKDLLELAEAECLGMDILTDALASLRDALEREII
jgi:hypothetical protein